MVKHNNIIEPIKESNIFQFMSEFYENAFLSYYKISDRVLPYFDWLRAFGKK